MEPPAKRRKMDENQKDLLPFHEIQNFMVRILNKVMVEELVEMATSSRVVKVFLEANSMKIMARLRTNLYIGDFRYCPFTISFSHIVGESSLFGITCYNEILINHESIRECDTDEMFKNALKNKTFTCMTLELDKTCSSALFLDFLIPIITFKKLRISHLTPETLAKLPSTCLHLEAYEMMVMLPFQLITRFESFKMHPYFGSGLLKNGIQSYVREFIHGDRGRLKRLVVPIKGHDRGNISGYVEIYKGVLLHDCGEAPIRRPITLSIKSIEQTKLMAVTKSVDDETWELISSDRRELIRYWLGLMDKHFNYYKLSTDEAVLTGLIPQLMHLPLEDFKDMIDKFIAGRMDLKELRDAEERYRDRACDSDEDFY